jgi:cell division protein FtsQ
VPWFDELAEFLRIPSISADDTHKADVMRATGLRTDAPIFGVDLDGLRKRVEAVGWVKSARVVRLLPATMVISITERRPAAVWQFKGHVGVIDDEAT